MNVPSNKEGVDANTPIYTKMSRRHLSLETLREFRIDYELDEASPILLVMSRN